MKAKEVSAFARRLLSGYPDFKVQGRLIFQHPIVHTLKGVYFDESIAHRRFYAEAFIQPLYLPAQAIVLSLGWRLGGGACT